MRISILSSIFCLGIISPLVTFWCVAGPEIVPLDIFATSFKQEQQNIVLSRYATCIRDGNSGSDEFFCPSKDSGFFQDGKPITNEIIAYNLAVESVFQKIDEKTKEYKKQLQDLRCVDAYQWKDNIRTELYGKPSENKAGVASLYESACNFGYIQSIINYQEDPKNPKPLPIKISETDTYPQTICMDLAKRKVQSLSYAGDILTARGTAKTLQNDKDRFIDAVKWRYRTLLDKIHELMQIIDRASSKKTGNDIDTVR